MRLRLAAHIARSRAFHAFHLHGVFGADPPGLARDCHLNGVLGPRRHFWIARAIYTAFLGPRRQVVLVRTICAAFSVPRRLFAALMRVICTAFLGPRRQVRLMRAICTAFSGPRRQAWLMRSICAAFWGRADTPVSRVPDARLCAALSFSRRAFLPFGVSAARRLDARTFLFLARRRVLSGLGSPGISGPLSGFLGPPMFPAPRPRQARSGQAGRPRGACAHTTCRAQRLLRLLSLFQTSK